MKTNRRNFIKGVTGFVAGVVAAFVPKAKAEEWKVKVAPYNGNATSEDIEIVGIDKLEVEEFEYWYLPEKLRCDRCRKRPAMHTVCRPKTERICCQCYVEEGYPPADWHPECMKAYKRSRTGEINPYSMSSRQQYLVGTRLVTSECLRFRYVKKPMGTDLLGRKTTRPYWCWVPEDEFIANPPEEFLTMLRVEL